MLGKFNKMPDLLRRMELQETQLGELGAPPVLVRQAVASGLKTNDIKNDHPAGLGDLELCGLRLDQRAELVSVAHKLLDLELSEPEVHAALEQFAKSRGWAPLSPVILAGVVESGWDALWEAEAQGETAAVVRPAVELVPEPDQLLEYSLAEVAPEPVRWLWPGKIPLGKVTVIYGEAGIGKTGLALDLAARVSSGTQWPDESGAPQMGRVLIVNGEDHLQDTICPRLASSGAHLQNISVIAGMQPPATPGSPGAMPRGASAVRGFDLGHDLPVLRQRIEAQSNVRLVIIDPFEAYCGKMGSNRMKLRELIAQLTKLAADYGVAIVVISAATKCDLPVKNVWRVDCEVLNATSRCWVPVRFNYGPLPAGMAFGMNADGVAWHPRADAPTADGVRGTSARHERCRQLQENANWLREYLAGEPRPAKEVLAAAGAAGWSNGQVKRVKRELGVRCYKESASKGRWFWELPHPQSRPTTNGIQLLAVVATTEEQVRPALVDNRILSVAQEFKEVKEAA